MGQHLAVFLMILMSAAFCASGGPWRRQCCRDYKYCLNQTTAPGSSKCVQQLFFCNPKCPDTILSRNPKRGSWDKRQTDPSRSTDVLGLMRKWIKAQDQGQRNDLESQDYMDEGQDYDKWGEFVAPYPQPNYQNYFQNQENRKVGQGDWNQGYHHSNGASRPIRLQARGSWNKRSGDDLVLDTLFLQQMKRLKRQDMFNVYPRGSWNKREAADTE